MTVTFSATPQRFDDVQDGRRIPLRRCVKVDLLCRRGGVVSLGTPPVDTIGGVGGIDTRLASSRSASSASSGSSFEAPAWLWPVRVDPGIHYPPATDPAGGHSPNVVGDHGR